MLSLRRSPASITTAVTVEMVTDAFTCMSVNMPSKKTVATGPGVR